MSSAFVGLFTIMLLGEKKFTEQIYYKNVNLSLPILSWSNLAAQAVIGLNSTIHNSTGHEKFAIIIYAISEYQFVNFKKIDSEMMHEP